MRVPPSVPPYIKKFISNFIICSTVQVIVYSNTVFSLLLLQSLKSLDKVNTALIEFLETSRPYI